MSSLESIIWHVLGYAAMPAILVFGYLGVTVVSLWILSMGKDKKTG
ncbi:TIGR02808 family protein [Alginatibacterium sediminis]|uniref:TIGR02808 family protein n=1 Tax=Alginatibacterium sediminis TaxID=2164068 RepID=A0A420EHR4_9ALTE|nr:TIGR02808 family protein [Alginatibacterium sediminis]RKF20208.1 TIGR02808 family protein [Alginatibacterium sediminis]